MAALCANNAHSSTAKCADYARDMTRQSVHAVPMGELQKEWLKSRKKEIGVGDQEIGEAIGRDRTIATKLLNGQIPFDFKYIDGFSRVLRISKAEVLRRFGILDEDADAIPGPSGASLDDLAAEHGLVFVDEIDLAFGMGATFLDDREPEVMGIVPFRENWLHGLYSGDVKHLKVVRGRGDSMEPTIRDGDTVLVDTSLRRIDDQDRIWAISYGDLGMIRRIRVTPKGSWMLMPDNQVVRPDEVGDGETFIIGRVIWIGRRI